MGWPFRSRVPQSKPRPAPPRPAPGHPAASAARPQAGQASFGMRFGQLADYHMASHIGRRVHQSDRLARFSLEPRPAGRGSGQTGGSSVPASHLFVVADGVGSHEAAGVAAEVVVSSFAEAVRAGHFTGPQAGARFQDAVTATIALANQRIARMRRDQAALEGMATTALAVMIRPEGLQWASVGDSPLVLQRGQQVSRLNADHSVAGIMQQRYKRAPDDPELDGYRHLLAASLGGGPIDFLDVSAEPFRPLAGDTLLIASDGILTVRAPALTKIVEALWSYEPAALTRTIIDTALALGPRNQDNISVAVARWR